MNSYYRIADHIININNNGNELIFLSLLPSFIPFKCEKPVNEELLFKLTIDESIALIEGDRVHRIRAFDTGNGDTVVDLLDDGGYQFVIKNLKDEDCVLLITNKDFSDCRCRLFGTRTMQSFGLNNALMLIMAFAGSSKDTILVHASLVRHNGYGYAFIAKSGTGKSTQVSLWLRYIPNCDLMNDDNPVIRLIDGVPYIYGSPWSGKTPCYRNVKAPLGAITRIDRAKSNSVEKLSPVLSFASILPSCSSMKWDNEIFNNICNVVSKIIEKVSIYTLHCTPEKEAAEICQRTISKQ
ncbi:hypothetical protein prwr041_24620 [Prevotella herbatica]|uniref:SynChlorMet cassette protein ScmC n=1 Tax=Prevotella herbatica TaxID=2801997 RepID=A0ABM7P1G4_9BACT|nr:hypothetical protein [Prevotella herbatica]BCS86569.1 hypothetical protein prwr041_24620 [Prevotella herbatica]